MILSKKSKKCCGKKIKFMINWIFNRLIFDNKPVINGYQWINLEIIADTAPERT